MADYRTRNRDTSIFSDDGSDDHWRSDQPRSRAWRDEEQNWNRSGQSDRGFFERAGDEVRSWFGDEDAERRRERDAREGETQRWGDDDRYSRSRYPSASRDYYGERSTYREGGSASGGTSGERNFGRAQAGWRESGFERGRDRFSGHQDDSYRRWRDEQIASLDSEYDEYCRHRQQQFEQDFSNFRQGRQGITSGGTSMNRSAQTGVGDASVQAAAAARPSQDAATLSSGAETVAAGDTQSAARAVRKN